jgi:hypothetical protein
MFVEYKRGDWVLYKDHIAYVVNMAHQAPHRVCIEYPIDEQVQAHDWVHNSAVKKLDPAVSSLLSSIYQVV